ncbi:hypothetical protein BGW36DRAFT_369360 [Talaromyces proteolyticus]|uniref:Uncharacterized protein n=1 Tax=Talaromyces proteolyticus TaxID=1131652 RepID=A0AAD4KXN1_9EURO|nr:uncharacterized protein BGW36DRAFT_369360 [Talaromyces proteolyticus]KAH8703450.1 hypothetical protein BGW36DRAFT_369360 [Talaromyces proteolyticus]
MLCSVIALANSRNTRININIMIPSSLKLKQRGRSSHLSTARDMVYLWANLDTVTHRRQYRGQQKVNLKVRPTRYHNVNNSVGGRIKINKGIRVFVKEGR